LSLLDSLELLRDENIDAGAWRGMVGNPVCTTGSSTSKDEQVKCGGCLFVLKLCEIDRGRGGLLEHGFEAEAEAEVEASAEATLTREVLRLVSSIAGDSIYSTNHY